MNKLHVVVGGQFGSEGKGAIAAHLTHPDRFDGVAIRVAGPNAGHTVIDPEGRRWPLRCIPVAAVVNPEAALIIAAGSEVDLDVLASEVKALEAAGHKITNRLHIDQHATVIDPEHRLREEQAEATRRTGSTNKGIGMARVDRLCRVAATVQERRGAFSPFGVIADTGYIARAAVRTGRDVLIEGTQGYGLGLHTRYYPYTTSQDCRAIDFLAQAGVSPWLSLDTRLRVWVTVRPNPIRIAGNSGPLRGETTWENLGLPAEQTTVTHRTRRVGEWDPSVVADAVVANGGGAGRRGNPVRIALTMADHVDPTVAGVTDRDALGQHYRLMNFVDRVEAETSTEVELIGTSDRTVIDRQL